MQSTRMYILAHTWLSGVQKGIQGNHATVEVLRKFPRHPLTRQWMNKDKTIILLEGGPSGALREAWNILKQQKLFPAADFHEDQFSLEGARTAVAVILPEWFFTLLANVRKAEAKGGGSQILIEQAARQWGKGKGVKFFLDLESMVAIFKNSKLAS